MIGMTVDPIVVNPDGSHTITGHANPGSTVTIRDANGNVIGTGTADPTTGDYSITIPSGSLGPIVVQCEGKSVEVELPGPSPEASFKLLGITDPKVAVQVTDGYGNVLGSTTSDKEGQWRIVIEDTQKIPDSASIVYTATQATSLKKSVRGQKS